MNLSPFPVLAMQLPVNTIAAEIIGKVEKTMTTTDVTWI